MEKNIFEPNKDISKLASDLNINNVDDLCKIALERVKHLEDLIDKMYNEEEVKSLLIKLQKVNVYDYLIWFNENKKK